MNDRPSHRLKQDKRALRRAVLAERDALSGTERAARSEAIVDRLLGLEEATGAGLVLAFWSFGSEVGTAPLLDRLRSRGTTVALPRTRDGDIVPVIWTPGSSMTEIWGSGATAATDASEPWPHPGTNVREPSARLSPRARADWGGEPSSSRPPSAAGPTACDREA